MNIKESDVPKNSMLQDPVGDTSSKRVVGFLSLCVALSGYLLIVITGKAMPEMVLNMFNSLLIYSAVCFSLTLPEHVSTTLYKE